MLVEEIVPLARSYFAENPYSTVLERFDYILVDEYQDLNRADHGVIELLAEAALRRGGQTAIIGDDDQCSCAMRTLEELLSTCLITMFHFWNAYAVPNE